MSTRLRLNDEFDPALMADALRPFFVTLIESIVKGAGVGGSAAAASVGLHDLDTSHSGSLPWARVNKVGSALSDLASRAHAALTGLEADDHPQYVHTTIGRTIAATHTFAGTTGFTSPDADQQFVMGRALVGRMVSGGVGHDDYAGFAHRDHANTSGYGFLQGGNGYTFINAPTGAAILHRINNADVMAMDAARLNPAGSILKDLGDYNRKWRTLFAAELYVETLVAQSVLATIGGRIMVAPTAKLIADVNTSQTTIDTDYSSLLVGDYTYMATAPGGLAQIEVMKITGGPTAITGGYRYSVTRALDGTPANSWVAGDAIVSLGNAAGKGYIELTSTSTIHNHLGPNITIYSRVSTANWNDVKPVVTMGNLRSFVDYSTDEVGLGTGNDLTLSPASGFKGVTIDRTNGIRQFNTSIKQYQSGALFLTLDTNGLYFSGVDQAYAKVRWAAAGGVPDYDIGAFTGGDSYNRMDLRAWSASKSAVRLGAWNSSQTNSPVAYVEVRQDAFVSRILAVSDSLYINNGIEINDTRNTNTAPTGYSKIIAFDFKLLSTLSAPGSGTYGGLITIAPWNHNSGDAHHQMLWNEGGIFWRQGQPESASWDAWHRVVTSPRPATAWSTSNWGRGLELGDAVAVVWNVGGGVSRNIGASGGTLYLGRSTASDNSAAPTYDMWIDSTGGVWLPSSGVLRVGNGSDLFGAKIQTSGNIHAQGAITSDSFWQVAATTPPGAASGYCRVTLRSSDNALVAVMPSGNVRVLAVN